MNSKIRHEGVIESIDGQCVKVRIVQSSACSGCKVAGHCNSSVGENKVVDVYVRTTEQHNVGDNVWVEIDTRQGYFALLIGFIIPLFLLIVVAFVVAICSKSEPEAALSAIASLAPYYVILYILKNRIQKHFFFHMAT